MYRWKIARQELQPRIHDPNSRPEFTPRIDCGAENGRRATLKIIGLTSQQPQCQRLCDP